VLCGLTSLQTFLLWKFSITFLLKYTGVKEGIFTTLSEEPLTKFLEWTKVKRTEAYLELLPVANGKPHCWARNTLGSSLFSTNAAMEILFYASQCALLDIKCWCTSPSSTASRRCADSTDVRNATINGVKGVKYAWVWKSALKIPLCVQPYSFGTIITGFTEN
jgi:hypothetical protein